MSIAVCETSKIVWLGAILDEIGITSLLKIRQILGVTNWFYWVWRKCHFFMHGILQCWGHRWQLQFVIQATTYIHFVAFFITILTTDSKTEKGSLIYCKSSGELVMVGNFENIELSMGENLILVWFKKLKWLCPESSNMLF